MTDLKKIAQRVNNAYETTYTESGLVAALRELVYQLQYYNFGECGEDMIIDARAILDVADELEALGKDD
jgi:hypothetical protein